MNSKPQAEYPLRKQERNPAAHEKHRREFWAQILLPLIVFLVILGLGFDFVLAGGAGSLDTLSQIGSIFMLLPLLMLALIFLVLVIGLIYLIGVVMHWLPPNAFRLQKQIQRLNNRVQAASDMATEPFLRLDSWSEAASRLFKRFQ